jgi:hypothetical protein
MNATFFDQPVEEQTRSLTQFAHEILTQYGIKDAEVECINFEFNATFSVTTDSDTPEVFTKILTANYDVSIKFTFSNIPLTIIDWGDGTTTNVTIQDFYYRHEYSSNISEIKIYCCDFLLANFWLIFFEFI